MSNSEQRLAHRMVVTSDDDVRITIYDALGAKVGDGESALDVAMPVGLYRVQLERNGRVETHLVDHAHDTELHDQGPKLETPTPLRGAKTSLDGDADCAERLCGTTTCPPLGTPPHVSRLFTFIRRKDRDRRAALPSSPVTVHDVDGRKLGTLCPRTSRVDEARGYLAFSAPVAAGTYRLRVARGHREIAITVPAGRAAHVFIVDAETVRLDDLRVALPPVDRRFDASSQTAVAMESVLARLRANKRDVPSLARKLWRDGVREDLSFGIALAHLLWQCEDWVAFASVMEQLAPYVAAIPDLAILDHAWSTKNNVASQLTLSAPPLMHASIVLALKIRVPVKAYSASEQAAPRAYYDSIWYTWSPRPWDAHWVDPTVDAMRAAGDQSIDSMARTIALPARIVEQSIARANASRAVVASDPLRLDPPQVPGYKVGEPLGRGSQGAVYRATRDGDGASVALKIVQALPSATREPEVMSRFDHVAILKVHARGTLPKDDGLWFETELCQGSMRDLLARTNAPLPVHQACAYVLQALWGLEHMHARKHVHCDIKPANLLIRFDGSVVIADLGLARKLRRGPQLEGLVGGTARFAPREQLLDHAEASPAWDVWSMAATLYFLLTLELPRDEFGGQSERDAALNNPVVPIAERRSDLAGALAQCIDRALFTDASLRPKSGAAFRRALQAAIEPTTTVRKRRALVIGAQGRAVQGANHDAQRMARMLDHRGFDVDLRIDGDATRAGILHGYDRLIEASSDGDAAVIYYSGNGFSGVDPDTGELWSGIVPSDQNDSADDAWRGITGPELAIKHRQLTDRTRNVTVILDCCYAAQMSRAAATQLGNPRALALRPPKHGFDKHLQELRAAHGPSLGGDLVDNPDVVVLGACGRDESAYEYRAEDGTYRGAFTDALIEVLDTVDEATTSWRAIGRHVRERVLARFPSQRPYVDGPVERRPFSLFEGEDLDEGGLVEDDNIGLPVRSIEDDELLLAGGRLLGIALGDVYAVMPPGSTRYDAPAALGEVVVMELRATVAIAGWRTAARPVPAQALAFPTQRRAIQRPVALDAPPEARPGIEQAITAFPTLRIADPDELGVLATVRLVGDELTIQDAWGPLFPPASFADGLRAVARNVANLAAAQSVRELEGARGVLADELDIELGTVVNGTAHALPDHGAALGLGDRLYVKIASHSNRRLFAHVFNIGLQGRIALVTSRAHEGVELDSARGAYVLGAGARGALEGLVLSWPQGLPHNFPRLDEVIVIVTTAPTSLQFLETRESFARGQSSSMLEDLLAGLHDRRGRNVVRSTPIEGFYVKRLSYLLHPRQGALGGLAFEIDENPLGQGAARDPAAWITPGVDSGARTLIHASNVPGAISICLADVSVENGSAFASSKLRLDATICTRSDERGSGQTAWTQTVSAAGDAPRVPQGDRVLYRGPVCDFVDVTLFASRDGDTTPPLEELFAQRASTSALQDARDALVTSGAGAARPWVTAVGASAALARMAYELLSSATQPIALYRTSFSKRDQFGIGRHPLKGGYRAHGISFSLRIDPVES